MTFRGATFDAIDAPSAIDGVGLLGGKELGLLAAKTEEQVEEIDRFMPKTPEEKGDFDGFLEVDKQLDDFFDKRGGTTVLRFSFDRSVNVVRHVAQASSA